MLRFHFYKRKSLSATSFDGRNQSNTYTFIYIFFRQNGPERHHSTGDGREISKRGTVLI